MKKLSNLLLLSAMFVFVTLKAYAPNATYVTMEDDDDDDDIVLSLVYNTLMYAESIGDQLDVELTGDNTAGEMLVFGMRSQEMKHVKMTLKDLNGGVVYAEREFDIYEGASYRALNVTSIPEGNYILTLEEGGAKKTKLIGVVRPE